MGHQIPFCKIPISLIGIKSKNVCTFVDFPLRTSSEFMVSPDQVHLLSVFQTGEFYILGDHCEFLKPLFVGKLSISIRPLNLDQSEFKACIEENEYLHLCSLSLCLSSSLIKCIKIDNFWNVLVSLQFNKMTQKKKKKKKKKVLSLIPLL